MELMDGNTLRACAEVHGVPDDWRNLPQDTAALLVEFRAASRRITSPTSVPPQASSPGWSWWRCPR